MSTALNQAFNDKVVVTGLGKTLTELEAYVQSIVHRVLQGETKAIPEFLRMCEKAKLFKPVPDPTRLTGVVVAPAAYLRDSHLGIQQGWYHVRDGLGFWVHPKTKEVYT
jgi:hypothetical protein